jgi:hypothetical protein
MPPATLKSFVPIMRLKLSIGVGKKQAGAAQTYIGLVGDAVVGYYTLTVGQVTREEAPERLTKGLARHPVPIMLLARLAVAVSSQGQGVGKSAPARCDAARGAGGRYCRHPRLRGAREGSFQGSESGCRR